MMMIQLDPKTDQEEMMMVTFCQMVLFTCLLFVEMVVNESCSALKMS